jgi:hypothetical protein
MVYDSIDAYRLWQSDLERYLRSQFPGEAIEVTVRSYRLVAPRQHRGLTLGIEARE